MQYEYAIEEQSQDTRTYTIKSNVPLAYEWLKENWHQYCDSSTEAGVIHENVEVADELLTTLEVITDNTEYGETLVDVECVKGDFADEEADEYHFNEDTHKWETWS